MKKLEKEGNLNEETIESVMKEEKPNQKEFIKIHNERKWLKRNKLFEAEKRSLV